ncbi:MAG: hypothetical protein LBC42_00580 [Puniceicoccales bacterium]|nr:hypothetical protein [Puniceicoccales bacterium]
MEIEKEKRGELVYSVKCIFPAEEVAEMRRKLVAKFAQRARLPGFRDGKAPIALVEKKLTNEIDGEVKEALGAQSREAMRAEWGDDIWLIEGLRVENTEVETTTVQMEVILFPQLQIPDYSNLDLPIFDTEPLDSAVQEVVANLRRLGQNVATENPAAQGDIVCVSYDAQLPNGVTLNDEKSNVLCHGDELCLSPCDSEDDKFSFLYAKLYAEALGMRAGEERMVRVQFPETFWERSLAGVSLDYNFKVLQVKTTIFIDENKDLLAFLGVPNEETLYRNIRQKIFLGKLLSEMGRQREYILDYLLTNTQFPAVPAKLYQPTIAMEFDIWNMSANLGKLPEETGTQPTAEMVSKLVENGKRDVHAYLLAKKIARMENITVTEEVVYIVVQDMCVRFGIDLSAFEACLERNKKMRSCISFNAHIAAVVEYIFKKNFRREKLKSGPVFEEAMQWLKNRSNVANDSALDDSALFDILQKMSMQNYGDNESKNA